MSNLEFTHNPKLLAPVGSVSIQNSGISHPQITAGGNTVLHIAAMQGKLNLATEALTQKPELLGMKNPQGDTPLHLAARDGQVKMVKHFVSVASSLSSLHELVYVMNNSGNTALHEAVQHDCFPVVDVLLKAAPSASAFLTSPHKVSALYMAAVRCSTDIVCLLLQIDEASCEGPDEQTALHAAVSTANCEIAYLLAKARPTLLTRADKAGNTPLHLAAFNGDCRMVQVLLQGDPSAVLVRNKVGLTPIHVATRFRHLSLVQFLIEKCPYCVELVDNVEGWNFFHVAIIKQVISVVDHVLASASLIKLVNVPDKKGNTPLHLAVLFKSYSVLKKLTSRREFITSAINHKGDTAFDVVLYTSKASGSLVSEKSEVAERMMTLMEYTSSEFIDPLRFGTPQLEHIQMSLTRDQDIADDNVEATRYKSMFENMSVVAVLIATATFAAVVALPGGYQSDQGEDPGTACLAKRVAFDAFLLFDTFAMVSSLISLIAWGLGNQNCQTCTIFLSVPWLRNVTVAFMLAFACGVFVVIPDKRLGLGIFIFLMVLGPLGIGIVGELQSQVHRIFRFARSSNHISHVFLKTWLIIPFSSFLLCLKQSSPFHSIYDRMIIFRLGPLRFGNYNVAWDFIYPYRFGYSIIEGGCPRPSPTPTIHNSSLLY